MYRLHVHDAQHDRHALADRQGRRLPLRRSPKRAGEALPVTVFLGGPPALILAAIAPLPENVPELMLASLIAGRAAAQLSTGPGPHPLVADAEFALIGEVPPRVRRPEGPFGDHYGYYSLQHDYPVFDVRADRAPPRRDLSGDGRRQAAAGGLLHRRPAAGAAVAAVPAGDAGRRASSGRTARPATTRSRAAVVKQRYEREAMASAFRILGEGQLSLTKFLLVTDQPRRPEGLPRDARARAGAHAPRDRPLRVLEPVDGHARLHRARR